MESTPRQARTLAYLATVSVEEVRGIGPKTAAHLEKLGISSVTDLLLHVPRRYLDRSRRHDMAAVPLGEEVTVLGRVLKVERRRISKQRTMTVATVTDGTSRMRVVWFNPYVKVAPDWEVVLAGKVERRRGALQMTNPDMDRIGTGSLVAGRIVPIHPAVGKFGPNKLRHAIANAVARSRPIADPLPASIREAERLVDRDRAIQDIHFPERLADADAARRRLAFDELFRLQLALALRRRHAVGERPGIAHAGGGTSARRFLESLPFEPTAAQRRALAEIDADLRSPRPMHRLLQGEVGSGKTMVAVAAMLRVVDGGAQAAVMAPTEVLATQHYLGVRAALRRAGLDAGDAVTTTGVRVGLLTGDTTEVDGVSITRSDAMERLATGAVDIVFGTHALIQEGVVFGRLGLAIVDEQHRFGVHQRVKLREQGDGYDPDLLIMTATPIPRTLAMTLYGDLDVSALDELPPGRRAVETYRLRSDAASWARIFEEIRRTVARGERAFVVCPLVEDSEKLAVRSATAEHARLAEALPGIRVGLLHGQLPPAEKAAVMAAFRGGDLDVLVATTVVEVGIDVPEATLIVIEDAYRFGLSQLHQLRGRVGRGSAPARCLLAGDPTTSEAERRLAAMVATTDGFRLAEEDLRIRGQGTIFGARQAGLSDLRVADVLADADLLVAARREAFALVDADPELHRHPELAEEVRALLGEDAVWLERS